MNSYNSAELKSTNLWQQLTRACGNLFALPEQTLIARWFPVPLRLIVGYGFMQHGFAKLSKGPDAFAMILQGIGAPAPHFLAWITILVEVFGGLAVLIGVFVPLVSVPMSAVLIVAILTVHLPYGFSSIKLISVTAGRAQFGPPGYEVALLYLACLAALVIGGSGPLSIDAYIRRRIKTPGSKILPTSERHLVQSEYLQ
jgi:putative oxidoreductase